MSCSLAAFSEMRQSSGLRMRIAMLLFDPGDPDWALAWFVGEGGGEDRWVYGGMLEAGCAIGRSREEVFAERLASPDEIADAFNDGDGLAWATIEANLGAIVGVS